MLGTEARVVLLLACLGLGLQRAVAVILTPPYFNLAEGRRVTATATCGEDIVGPELYCKLVGANADRDVNINLIQGQVCDYCDPTRPDKAHPASYSVDGAESWWQSPPLSRGMKYNEVNLTIDLGQEFHVAYVFIKMANSPRPAVWVLERSIDNGETYEPWQYFADTLSDCENYFGKESLQPITRDNSVTCETQYSKVVPLEGGEIVVSLLKKRPSANDFFNSTVLQEWTRATNVRLRFLRTKTLLGHLMSVARQDPTVTRRYFYSIKDISIGGRCVCNGHADTCDITDPKDPYKLLCRCQHNTCGDNCDTCCKGFEQKAWRQSKSYKPFICEPCNCFGHTEECEYSKEVDEQRLSLDIHGNYEGGGVCKNCRDNTEGINCDRCKPGFFRPYEKHLNDTDVCQPCDCNQFYSTGNCEEGSGQCECRIEFTPPNCDDCSVGYYGYPNCRPCECYINGTRGSLCEPSGGSCPCKQNYRGKFCKECEEGYYNFPECLSCECNPEGSSSEKCDAVSGQCTCKNNYGGRTCDECQDGYSNYPECRYCNCDVRGTRPGTCDKQSGECLCREGYAGERCDRCEPGYYGYPDCRPCGCSEVGSSSTVCDASGRCTCLSSFSGRTCSQCSPGHYQYPECLSCNCDTNGAIGVSCDNDGKCQCKNNFDGYHCEQCKEGFYNFPICEECNCDPAGVVDTFKGCGSLPPGELCQCKERVQGRICNQCRPLFWNLQASNKDACEECECFVPGVMGGLEVCDTKSGQCVCKPSVTSRKCDECKDGTYNLVSENLFGCTDCGCDIGGSLHNTCDKQSGQCPCRPRIDGRTCKEPLKTHYFPTLHDILYEAEDGHTPSNTPVRYGNDEIKFPNYSWRGYAVFSSLQDEIIQNVWISKPSLYRMVLRYINNNDDSIIGHIAITPDNPNDVEQSFQVLFRPTGRTPSFVTVSGPSGSIPSPLVMNPGGWSISIRNEKNLLVDYFVLLPAAYYEATVLVDNVVKPCEVGEKGLCRHYRYPNISHFDTVYGDGGFLSVGGSREGLQEYYRNNEQLRELNKGHLPLINRNQQEIHLEMTVSKPGPHVLLINYLTPANDSHTSTLSIDSRSRNGQQNGEVIMYACSYTSMCRQAVQDRQGRLAIFNFDSNFVSLVLKGAEDTNVALDSVVAIPYDEWSMDFQQPKPACVRRDGKCLQALFPRPPDSKKVEFESGNEQRIAKDLPPLFDNNTNLVYLDHNDPMIDVIKKVPQPGPYVFVVHYYQPDHPEFDLDIVVQNGQYYEAKLPVLHCPSNSGCRSVIKQADGNTNFYLTENYVLTLKEPDHKSVWLDYVLVIPAEQYSDHVLLEEPVDHTGTFIKQCGNNHFYLDTNTEGFCRDAVFSLTADYNNGAIPCLCNFQGSLSFECEKFGGQCECKPNVIGRTCEACKTGYYGFPDCRRCDCPSTALCESDTGECICPPRVTGEKCDQCVPYTYGFDNIIGCEECNCEPLGVLHGNLQCNLQNGSCDCKPNIVGRTCDRCRAGYWGYPMCHVCDCDQRGTTINICDQNSAECFCKPNVYGQACDLCKEGTFNIQENNPDGCTKCFCSGKTSRCSSSNLYRTQVSLMKDWRLAVIELSKRVEVEDLSILPVDLDRGIGADLSLQEIHGRVVYFVAPDVYLGNKLTSYGGNLNYTVFYTTGLFGSAESGPDVILHSGDLYLLHYALEKPDATIDFQGSVEMLESNFLLPSGLTATREQIMQVLYNLQNIYIRATYWKESVTTRLSDVTLDIAETTYNPQGSIALAVEQCVCPPNYQGLSCEECAPGYYRSQTGPYGGFCVPCNCNGHSTSCDPVTGNCFDCKNNTEGDHCERCISGHYGNATQGTQVDCLICACPLPIASNNFATGCEVSADGEEISCDCIEGYYGARCEVCAAGHFGRPEFPGESCQKCTCSGNINPDDPGSCDSVTGECLRCLNNTYGEACNLCAPGFYGDAVERKDCQSCICDKCGTKECDSYNGICQCHENVVGDKCDRCEIEHYGFTTCQGCTPCNCQEASESTQCDDITGECRCMPGVNGRTCNQCSSGYWNYSSSGCISCGCNTEYSLGLGCNNATGQCQCLPGVIGEKCDHCPYRWVLIEREGCFECDSCTHDLLDVTDMLRNLIDPVASDFQSVAVSYFTTQRLVYINNTASKLAPDVSLLGPGIVDLTPHAHEVESLEQDARNMHRRAEYSVSNGEQSAPEANKVRLDALEVEQLIQKMVDLADTTVIEVNDLALSLDRGTGPQIDHALKVAENILAEIQQRQFGQQNEDALEELHKAESLLAKMVEFTMPVHNQTNEYESLRLKIENFDLKLEDLRNYSLGAKDQAAKSHDLNEKNRNSKVSNKVQSVEDIKKETTAELSTSEELLKNATLFIGNARAFFPGLYDLQSRTKDETDKLDEIINEKEGNFFDLTNVIEQAKLHSDELELKSQELDSRLSGTRYTSEQAVGAANAYKNIADAIEEAMHAAKEALGPAENATSLSEGLGDRTSVSQSRSIELLENARQALDKAQRVLEPQLEAAKDQVNLVSGLNAQSTQIHNTITDDLKRISTQNVDSLAKAAIGKALIANKTAQSALQRINRIVDKLPEDVEQAHQLPKEADDTQKAIQQANNQIDRVTAVVPDINNLMNKIKEQQDGITEVNNDVGKKIEELKRNVALARDLANRIEVGATFYRNSTLELKNPESLPLLGTSTKISLYFKTDNLNGFLLYLGNEIGTSRRIRRAKTDDFIALEIENGFPVLTIDLGSGPERLIGDKMVADNEWYEAIIERTGKIAKLIIRHEGAGGQEEKHEKETILPGTYSILNLDQEHSKLYVGGYPTGFLIQNAVKTSSFEGQMEGLVIGGTPVSLWNFIDAANINGAKERDRLVNLLQSTGLRFDGSGYATIDGRSHNIKQKSHITINFRTFEKNGLLFFVGKARSFISIELRNGSVLYQFNLGSGGLSIQSPKTYNDGQWHTVEAIRQNQDGRLDIDQESIFQNKAPGNAKDLRNWENLYFGGYPGEHGVRPVTNTNFDGCIDAVGIDGTLIDLSQNKEAFGVTPGCPVQVASLVSFSNRNPGYVHWPNASIGNNLFQLTLKFKTNASEGLIFYGVDRAQENFISLSLLDGKLIFSSQREQLTTSSAQYNDNQWHVVTATHDNQALRLDIDDFETFKTDAAPSPLYIMYGSYYFGGLPTTVNIPQDTTASVQPFFGCLGDAVVNNVFINFANATDRAGALLGKCPTGDLIGQVPGKPKEDTFEESDLDEDIIPEEIPDEIPTTVPTTTPSTTTTTSTTALPTTTSSTSTTAAPTAPIPKDQCRLPLQPIIDPNATTETHGYFINYNRDSRVEYHEMPIGKWKNKYTFSLQFKTYSAEGILLYVANQAHRDFISLYLKNGKLIHSFNCGTGDSNITSPNNYNDGKWHDVTFRREHIKGFLIVDGIEIGEAESLGQSKSINVDPPFYIGGVSETIVEDVKRNVKTLDYGYEGCIKHLSLNGKSFQAPKEFGVTPCAAIFEEGIFFGENGGYVKTRHNVRVGHEMTIEMRVKARSLSGVLLSVHGKFDYLLLQMVNGNVKLSVDNGGGPISATFKPSSKYYLCDGQWHHILAVKNRNVITLSIDNMGIPPEIGKPGSTATDTNSPLILGGHLRSNVSMRGLEAKEHFVGCIRDVFVKGRRIAAPKIIIEGDVMSGSCPTT